MLNSAACNIMRSSRKSPLLWNYATWIALRNNLTLLIWDGLGMAIVSTLLTCANINVRNKIQARKEKIYIVLPPSALHSPFRYMIALFITCFLVLLSPNDSYARNSCELNCRKSSDYTPIQGTVGSSPSQAQESEHWHFGYLSKVCQSDQNEHQSTSQILYYELCNLYLNLEGWPLIAAWSHPAGFGTGPRGLRQSRCLIVERAVPSQNQMMIKDAPIIYSRSSRRKDATAYAWEGTSRSSSLGVKVIGYADRNIELSVSHFSSIGNNGITNQVNWSSDAFWVGFVVENGLVENSYISSREGAPINFIPLREAISDQDIDAIFRALDYRNADNWMVLEVGNSDHTNGRETEPQMSQFHLEDKDGQLRQGRVIFLIVERGAGVKAWVRRTGFGLK